MEDKKIQLLKDMTNKLSTTCFHKDIRTNDNYMLRYFNEFNFKELDKYIIHGTGHCGVRNTWDSDFAIMLEDVETQEQFWFHFSETFIEMLLLDSVSYNVTTKENADSILKWIYRECWIVYREKLGEWLSMTGEQQFELFFKYKEIINYIRQSLSDYDDEGITNILVNCYETKNIDMDLINTFVKNHAKLLAFKDYVDEV